MLNETFWDYFKAQVERSGREFFIKYREDGKRDYPSRADSALYPSNSTCGVGELGGLAGVPYEEVQRRVLSSLVDAFVQNRGLITYYHPIQTYRGIGNAPVQVLLREWGFERTREFVNPNTGKLLEELSVILPPRRQIESGLDIDAN